MQQGPPRWLGLTICRDLRRLLFESSDIVFSVMLCYSHGMTSSIPHTIVCNEAVRRGYLDILQWERRTLNRMHYTHKDAVDAATHDHLHVLKWLRAKANLPITWRVCSAAAATRCSLDTFMWVSEQCRWFEHNNVDGHIVGSAARAGRLDLLRAMKERYQEDYHVFINGYWCLIDAARGGHIDIIEWCTHDRSVWCRSLWEDVHRAAVMYEQLHVVNWVRAYTENHHAMLQ